jgi:hypothetical protein
LYCRKEQLTGTFEAGEFLRERIPRLRTRRRRKRSKIRKKAKGAEDKLIHTRSWCLSHRDSEEGSERGKDKGINTRGMQCIVFSSMPFFLPLHFTKA